MMTEHRFRSGQRVQLIPTTLNKKAARGPYEVLRELPYDAGEFRYRITSINEGYDRVVTEDELQSWNDGP